MVSAGFGITLLPELAIGVEERGRDITLVRFVEPEPSRKIGLSGARPRRRSRISRNSAGLSLRRGTRRAGRRAVRRRARQKSLSAS